jgi:transcriptional regulator with XRE-family HTH domain
VDELEQPWGKALKVLRVIRRWTQQELAAAVGMTASAISRFEGSSRRTDQEMLLRQLTTAMGFPGYLLDRALAFLRLAEAARDAHGSSGAGPAKENELIGRVGLWMEDLARHAFHQVLAAAEPGAAETGSAEIGEAAEEALAPQGATRPLPEALIILRDIAGWSQRQLATSLGVTEATVGNYERGNTTPDHQTLQRILGCMRLPPVVLERTLSFIEAARQARAYATPDGADAQRSRAEAVAARIAQDVEQHARATLDQLKTATQLLSSRQGSDALWQRLSGCSASERRALILTQAEFQTAGLCERLCEESIGVVGDDAARAVELAGLAAEVARRVPGAAAWRSRLEGFAGLHEANAVRVAGKPRRSRALSERAMALWQAGAAADPGLLNEARVLQMEAALRRNLRQAPEALALLDRALALDRWGERASLLVSKARTLEDLGRHEEAIALLREAMPQIDGARELRKLCAAKQNLLLNLCQLGRHGEALLGLPEVRAMARRLGRLDVARVDWLEGKIALGLGRHEEAIAALERARDEFRRQAIPYDTALVTMELAEVHAALGRFAEVKALALESAPVFREQGVHREARRALEVFRRAAEDERVTVDLIRRVIIYLYRARHDPRLRFSAAAA